MDETKKVLRSLLVSSPNVLTVMKLNEDYREVMGYDIPYQNLGYEKLLDFLKAIPDVLTVNGNSSNSQVKLIVTKKIAHINDMILKQKKGKSHYKLNSNPRQKFDEQGQCRSMEDVNLVTSPTSTKYDKKAVQTEENDKTTSLKATKSRNLNFKNRAKPTNQNGPSHPGSSKGNIEGNSSTNISRVPEEQPQALKTNCKARNFKPTRSLNRNFKNKPKSTNKNEICYLQTSKSDFEEIWDVDVSLPLEQKNQEEQPQTYEKQEYTILRRLDVDAESHRSENNTDLTKCRKLKINSPNKDKHYCDKLKYKENNYNVDSEDIISLLNVKIGVNELNRSDMNDSMDHILLQKYSSKYISQENSEDVNNDTPTCKNQSEIRHTESEKYDSDSNIPRQVQDNLKKLIQGIPEGIWYSQLPDEYKKMFRKELHFEKFGYRSLIHMCMDLKNIFHCNKESSFKLYDITSLIPEVEIVPDDQAYSENVFSFEEDEQPSLPALDWENCAQLFPKDVVGPGFIISRDFVSESEIKSDIFRVVVAEIYDPSKFWLFRDDGQLDALMDEMQQFYETNNELYRFPEHFVETGLYCVAMWQKKFHRCVIVKMQTDATFVHVFYIDYGSLGTVPKDDLWFLTEDFVRLPGQAIRARLADIYPPIQFTMWTSEARNRFKQLASMKHLEARIVRVSKGKKLIEVSIENPIAAPGRNINSILVDEGHALYCSQYRKMNIHDSNCTTSVNFIHLFPTFEEIEYWLAPSIEEIAWFSNTALTADFYIPQYFSRSIDENLHNNIEIEAMKLMKKKKNPIQYVDIKDLERIGNMKDIIKVSYGDLYEKYKEKLSETMEYCSQYCRSIKKSSENPNEENEWDLTDMDCVNSQLRRKSSDPNVPQYTTCYEVTNRDSPFSTAKGEMDESFEDSSRESFDKLRGQLDTWIDLSQLENNLSHQGPSTSSATDGNFIDTDESNPNKKSQKNESSDKNSNLSLLMSKGRRTEDEEEPRTERSSSCRRSCSGCSGRIQLDVPLECPILTPEIDRVSGSMSENAVFDSVSGTYHEEHENSNVKLNTSAETEVTFLPTEVNNTSTPTLNVQKCTRLGVPNAQCSSSSLGITSCSPRPNYQCGLSQYYQRRSSDNSLENNQIHFPSMRLRQDVQEINTCTSSPKVQECTSLSIPKAHCLSSNNGTTSLCASRPACHCQLGHSQYQQWPSGDCSENNPICYPSAQYSHTHSSHSMNTPSNEMYYTPEQFFTQPARTPIPVVFFNYNSRLPGIAPNVYQPKVYSDNWNFWNR